MSLLKISESKTTEEETSSDSTLIIIGVSSVSCLLATVVIGFVIWKVR